MKRLLVALSVLAVLGLALGFFGWVWFEGRLAPRNPTGQPIHFVVERGETLKAVAERLEHEGLVHAGPFLWWARYRELGSSLRAGEYQLTAASSAKEILSQLTRGTVLTHKVAIPEGLRATEIAERLEGAGLADAGAFLDGVRNRAWLAEWGLEGESFEGYLFPETYAFARGLSVREILETFTGEFRKTWREIESEAQAAGLSMREVVILASIVEKETGAASERPRIASVFLNRIAKGMRLQTDPTVIYGIENFDGNLTRAHLDDPSNPYNTYQIAGLPPGPIANPGADALRAVVRPEDSNYLYFVARGDGTHFFSRTYREHDAAVDKYQRRRRRN